LYPVLMGGGANVIPVPLTRWLRKTQEEQAQLLDMWRNLLGDIDIRMPELKHPEIMRVIEAIRQRYGFIGALFDSYGRAGLSASAAFEGSALLIQIQAVHDVFGPTATNLLANAILQQAPRSRYPVFLRAMAGFVEQGKAFENNTLTTLC